MDMTPQGKIFCTEQVKEHLSQDVFSEYVGKFSFHGILSEIPLYSLVLMTPEEITSLQKNDDSDLKACEDIVFRSSCVAAVLSVQPFPFLENLNLVAVHLYMILRISHHFGRPLNIQQGSQVF